MNQLAIGDLIIRKPIIQGGMGIGISLSRLAAAVANEGGVGIISAVCVGMTEPDYKTNLKEANKRALRKEIRKARALTNGVIGVNIMMAVSDYDDLFRIALEEKVDLIIIGAGLPLRRPAGIDEEMFKNRKTKIIPKISSARAANVIMKFWSEKHGTLPDAFVLEGPLAGGHLGFKPEEIEREDKTLEILVPETKAVIRSFEVKYKKSIPLIAGGGIYTGDDIYNITQLGADGVKMGTRFVTTYECDASMAFKQTYLDSTSDDIQIIESPVGLPGRVIANQFVHEINNGMQKPVRCAWQCLRGCKFKSVKFCIADALFSAAKGDFDNGFSFAGSNAWKAERIMSVHETFLQLEEEYQKKCIRRAAV
jgi:NAD(P)H-dependent flavin oxidoreductase YrpB (nitropropane dioxygenase family)